MKEFPLTISTPKKKLFEGKAVYVEAPGEEGQMTILAGHAPLLSNILQGNVIVKTVTETKAFEIHSGFLEVNEKGATILAKH